MTERLTKPESHLTEAQETALQDICDRYGVQYAREHYFLYPSDSLMMAGWAEGWVGGADIQQVTPTIYVGCSPEGQVHS